MITNAVMDLYDRIVDENLLVRRITITANKLVDENSVKQEDEYQQLDLFTDYEALKKKNWNGKGVCKKQCLVSKRSLVRMLC